MLIRATQINTLKVAYTIPRIGGSEEYFQSWQTHLHAHAGSLRERSRERLSIGAGGDAFEDDDERAAALDDDATFARHP